MNWLHLDTERVIARVRSSGTPAGIPTLGDSVRRGVAGFTLLSVAGFAPWAVLGRWLHARVGEGGLYAACALVFIGLSGPLLHGLILGPGSLGRFYGLPGMAFAANSVLWMAGWMSLGGHPGSLAGLLAGTTAMAWILAAAFGAREVAWKVAAALFLLNSAGYFAGGWIEGVILGMNSAPIVGQFLSRSALGLVVKLLWGVGYGIGFGAGLGLAMHWCQARTRAALAELSAGPDAPRT